MPQSLRDPESQSVVRDLEARLTASVRESREAIEALEERARQATTLREWLTAPVPPILAADRDLAATMDAFNAMMDRNAETWEARSAFVADSCAAYWQSRGQN